MAAARQSYGALPELKPKAIPTKSRAILQDAVDKLRGDVFRSGVGSVVDRAREAANVAFGAYMQSRKLAKSGLELFDLLKIHDGAPVNKKKFLAGSAANIARLLHSRGKGSQKERRPFRPLCEQDAELAVACVGTILCEFGWAEWPSLQGDSRHSRYDLHSDIV